MAPIESTSPAGLIRDVGRVVCLDASVHQRRAPDPSQTWTAVGLVVAVAVLSTIATALAGMLPAEWYLQPHAPLGLRAAVQRIAAEAFGVVFLSGAAYLTGVGLFGVNTAVATVLRAHGFAYVPMVTGGLVVVPVVGGLLSLVGVVWTVATMTVALRAVTRLSTGQATACVLWAFVLMTLGFYVVGVVPA